MSKIFDFKSRLAIILHCHDEDSLSLWTLNDHGDDGCGVGSWTKKLNLEVTFINMDLTAIYVGDGQLVAVREDNEYIIYDCLKKEIKKFQHPAGSYFYRINTILKYTESLVSVKGFETY